MAELLTGGSPVVSGEPELIPPQALAGITRLVTLVLEQATVVIMAMVTALVAVAVFFRYFINNPISASDELAALLLVWLTFLGAAVATRRRMHPSVNLFVRLLPSKAREYIAVVVRVCELSFLAYLCWNTLVLLQLRLGQLSAGLEFDMSLYPLALILGATGMFLFGLLELQALPRRPLFVMLAAAVLIAGAAYAYFPFGNLVLSRTGSMLVMIGGFLTLLVLNAPLWLALGLPSLVYLLILGGPNPIMLPQRLIAGANDFLLLAVPIFILAGALMETGGISRRLVTLATALVGHFRGGLAQVTVVGEILFSGISGAVAADVAAIGSILLPAMEKAGYKREEAVSIVSAAAAMGILVPPCLLMVIVAVIAEISVTQLFMAGFLPAFVIAACLMLLIYIKGRRENWPVATRASLRQLTTAARHAILPLGMPVLIFGSIFTGAATVTESAVLAVAYALFIGIFVYKEIAPRTLSRFLLDSAVLSSMSLWILAAASAFTWLLARNEVPQLVASAILSISDTPWFFIVASILIFTIFAALLEGFPAIVILGPLFYPIAKQVGMDPLHFSIILVSCVGIGLFLPPIGIGLFIACSIGGTTMARVTPYLLPYILVLLAGLLIVAFVPGITLVVPNLVFGH